MSLKDRIRDLAKTSAERHQERVATESKALGVENICDVIQRKAAHVGGEIKSCTVSPRAGIPSVEVKLTDGTGSLTVIFLGRRKVHGLVAGIKMIVDGVVCEDKKRNVMFNPHYQLIRRP